MAFLKNTIVLRFLDKLIESVFFGALNGDIGFIGYKGFIFSLLGAVMASAGILTFMVVKHAFIKKELWSWRGLFIAFGSMTVIDEFYSIFYKVYFNALFNLFIYVPIIVVLVLSRKYFVEDQD